MSIRMLRLLGVALLSATAFCVAVVGAGSAATGSLSPTAVPLTEIGQATLSGGTGSPDPVVDTTEIDQAVQGDTDSGDDEDFGPGVNRTLPGVTTGKGRSINPNKRAKSNPSLGTHFQGLNLHDQRFANRGNQFSVEPPDQGLCAGNGYLFENVNDVVQAYNTSGTPLLNGGNAVDLNTFFGYPAAINRTTGARGPSITDPSCLFDAQTNRFYFVVLTLDHVGTTASLNGLNHLDIAVSDTGNPSGSWTIYSLPVQNNGTQGTPDHHCNSGFCLGDYPHIGADANAIYLTTNEFAFSGPGFYGAQVYAIGKNLFTGGTGSAVLFNTLGAGPDGAGFTVWPASVPGTTYATLNGGSEYFLSSRAVFSDDGTSTGILLWTLSNSSSLNTASPAPALSLTPITVQTYAVPPRAHQPAGNRPLGECIGDTVLHPTCNTTIAGIASHNNATFGPPNGELNANDSRFGQVAFANGKLWGALGSAVMVGGQNRAGIAYYVVNPTNGKLVLQGQAGLAGTDMTYPTVGVLDSGRGIMSFTLTGDSDYPSAAYAPLDSLVGMGDVSTAQAGAGPWDGFTSYVVFGSGRPRWGDYGATAAMGNSIWAASEYVAQTCTYAAYFADPTCGGTRAPLGNWSTHISKLAP
jgi:hypothetical protein